MYSENWESKSVTDGLTGRDISLLDIRLTRPKAKRNLQETLLDCFSLLPPSHLPILLLILPEC